MKNVFLIISAYLHIRIMKSNPITYMYPFFFIRYAFGCFLSTPPMIFPPGARLTGVKEKLRHGKQERHINPMEICVLSQFILLASMSRLLVLSVTRRSVLRNHQLIMYMHPRSFTVSRGCLFQISGAVFLIVTHLAVA